MDWGRNLFHRNAAGRYALLWDQERQKSHDMGMGVDKWLYLIPDLNIHHHLSLLAMAVCFEQFLRLSRPGY